jgi:NDP-sugar pyrophosphorylase family protein
VLCVFSVGGGEVSPYPYIDRCMSSRCTRRHWLFRPLGLEGRLRAPSKAEVLEAMSQPGATVPISVTAVILAGGKGTRIAALYPDVPKPLIPVAERPFIFWVTAYLAHNGVRRFVYSAGHMADQIQAWSTGAPLAGLECSVVIETHPLGTGGALLHCLDHCGDSEWLLATNGDSLCLGGLPTLVAQTVRTEPRFAGGLIGLHQDDTSRFGSLEVDPADQTLCAFREKVPGAGLINGGTYLLRKSALLSLGLAGRPCSLEQEIIPRLIAEGWHLTVVGVKAPFIDIGTPASVVEADAFINANRSVFTW